LEIVLMRARREKRSSRLLYNPAQFIKHWLPVAHWRRVTRGEALRCSTPGIAAPCGGTRVDSTHNRDYNIMRQITIHIITLQK